MEQRTINHNVHRPTNVITYVPKTSTTTTVKLDGKIVGIIHEKKGIGFCYVPKGQSFSKGLFELHPTIEEVKRKLESE